MLVLCTLTSACCSEAAEGNTDHIPFSVLAQATMDWESQDDGYMAKLLVPDGAKDIPVGTPVAVFVEDKVGPAHPPNFSICTWIICESQTIVALNHCRSSALKLCVRRTDAPTLTRSNVTIWNIIEVGNV